MPAVDDIMLNVPLIQALEGDAAVPGTRMAHRVFVTAVDTDQERLLRQQDYGFSDDIICSKCLFNDGAPDGEYNLKTNFRIAKIEEFPVLDKMDAPTYEVDDNGDPTDVLVTETKITKAYVYWKLVIQKDKTEHIAHPAANDRTTDVNEALRRMRNMNIGDGV